MEERLPVWRVAANVLNKQPRTSERGGSPAWGLGEVLTTLHLKNVSCYDRITQISSDMN
jgi:hypothetical protein